MLNNLESEQEIVEKIGDMFNKMLDDEENYEQHFDKLNNYIIGINDLLKAQGKKGLASVSLTVIIFKALLDLRTRIKKNATKDEKKQKELSERLDRIEKEFKNMKAGK